MKTDPHQIVPSFQWSVLDNAALIAEDVARGQGLGTPLRVGVNRTVPGVPFSVETDGTWQVDSDGTRVWRLSFRDADARAIRVSFSRFDLPEGTSVTVQGVGGRVGVYKGRGPLNKGAFWASAVKGDTVVVEYRDPSGAARDPVIEIDEISHIYRVGPAPGRHAPDLRRTASTGGLLPCHVDVNCGSIDPNARDAVGRMEFTKPGDGTYLCSGALINDADENTFAGYFLTARHCMSTQAEADTLTVYWFYQSALCDGVVPDLFSLPTTLGAVFLGGSGINDSTLLRLLDDPHDGQGLAAWTTDPPAPGSTITVIHHPDGTFKRRAVGSETTDQPVCVELPPDRFVYANWLPGQGVTEGGSSGGPMFNANWEIVGQLFGACFFQEPGCTNLSSYNILGGRFSQTYPQISAILDTITPDDAFEDNDDIGSGPTLSLGAHALRLVDLVDYFNVAITDSALLTASVTFDDADMDLELALVHPNGVVIDVMDSVSGTASVSCEVLPGDYLVRLSKTAGWGGDYSLDLSVAPSDCVPAPLAFAEANPEPKNRYLSFVPGDDGGPDSAIGVWMMALNRTPSGTIGNPDFSAFEGQVRYVGPPQLFNDPTESPSSFFVAQLQCDPYYTNWSSFGLIHVTGPDVVPGSSYAIGHVRPTCPLTNPGNFSGPLVVTTRQWGNIVGPMGAQPNFADISAVVDKFIGKPNAVSKLRAQLQPDPPNPAQTVSFSDVNRVVFAFSGGAYPYTGPQICP